MKRRYMKLSETLPVTMEQIAVRLGVSVEELYRLVVGEQPKESA